MMEIGNGGLTVQEERSHFAAWIFLKVRSLWKLGGSAGADVIRV